MKTVGRLIVIIAVVSACLLSVPAQEPQTRNTLKLATGQKGAPAKIGDMAWLAGTWRGSGLGGDNEEIWSEPQGGVMMGMYRMLKDKKPIFYELLTLSEADGTLIIRLKHFHANFVGWEEKDKTVDFRWVKKQGNRYYFEGMTFEVIDPRTVNVYLAIGGKDGNVREETFRYKRVK
jgi:hypothetical protein